VGGGGFAVNGLSGEMGDDGFTAAKHEALRSWRILSTCYPIKTAEESGEEPAVCRSAWWLGALAGLWICLERAVALIGLLGG